MRFSFSSETQPYQQLRPNKRLLFIWAILGCIVLFLTIYLLIRPAHSLENMPCSLEEHTHDETCYEIHTGGYETVLSCSILTNDSSQNVAHTHDAMCLDKDSKLICPLTEMTHTHAENCYDETGTIICGIIYHQHDENCYTVLMDGQSARVLVCGMRVHTHIASCSNENEAAETTLTSETTSESTETEFMASISEIEDTNATEDAASYVEDAETYGNVVLEEMPIHGDDSDIAAIDLQENGRIVNATLSYRTSGTGWITIDGSYHEDLDAEAEYRLKVEYADISISELKDANYQVTFSGVPDWLVFGDTGSVVYNGEIVASIAVSDTVVTMTFDKDWIDQHEDTTTLSGDFSLKGTIDWRKLTDGTGEINLPGLERTFTFGNELASQYASVSIDKTRSELLQTKDGTYYFRYTITVKSLEDDIAIPDVRVEDLFTSNAKFVTNVLNVETGDTTSTVSRANGVLTWNIGDLEAKGERTLTYDVMLDSNYIGATSRGDLINEATLYSKDNEKDKTENNFTPQVKASVSKDLVESNVDEDGNGTISYRVKVSAPETNSYFLFNLRLHDEFNSSFSNYLSGDTGDKLSVDITSDKSNGKEIHFVDYNGASFDLTIDSLAPGETKTITYTVMVKNLYDKSNGNISLNNKASVYTETNSNRDEASNEWLATGEHTETFKHAKWVRKLVGGTVNEQLSVAIPSEEAVLQYDTDGNIIDSDTRPDAFIVQKDSLKYQVIINEDGKWDLSSTVMKDQFQTAYLQYEGYLQVQAFQLGELSSSLSDNEILSIMQQSDAVASVWLNVDALKEFSFTPEGLGLPDGRYSYLLTYYALPVNLDGIGEISVSNGFGLSGTITGVNGIQRTILGVKISVSSVIQGSIKYTVEKQGWYVTAAEDEGGVTENGDITLYKPEENYPLGIIYWVVKLEGTIPSQMQLKDKLHCEDMKFCYDAVAGVYRGAKDADITTNYTSFGEFQKDIGSTFTQLVGSPYNETKSYKPDNKEYNWWIDTWDNKVLFVKFQETIELEEDEAVYIVLRSSPRVMDKERRAYVNQLSFTSNGNDSSDYIDVNSATIRYNPIPLKKSGAAAYTYNKNTKKFTYAGGSTESNVLNNWNKNWLPESGTYVSWVVSVNYDGSLEGSVSLEDVLPDGLDFTYCDIYSLGWYARGDNLPVFLEIPELENNSNWQKDIRTNQKGTAITYYNPETKTLRWKIDNLTIGTFGYLYPNYHYGETGKEISLNIMCRVTDPDLLLNTDTENATKVFENTATIITEDGIAFDSTGSIEVTRDSSLDKSKITSIGDENSSILNFQIVINPNEESLYPLNTLPTLIDELSANLAFIESSLEVKDKNGNEIEGYAVSLEEDEKGLQKLLIRNLPNGKKIIITYEVRITAKIGTSVSISNKAYWNDIPTNDEAQWCDENYTYEVSGSVTLNLAPTVRVVKVDNENMTVKLSGAKFQLCQVNTNGTEEVVANGTTDASGELSFRSGMSYGTLYYLQETAAPEGYELDDTKYYFAFPRDISTDYESLYPNIEKMDLFYSMSSYTYTMKNKKGTIEVEKIFLDEDGNAYTPTSGTYRFGLYEKDPTVNLTEKPVQILSMTYTETGCNYYLDGSVQTSTPAFTQAELDTAYYIYELDDNGNPIRSDNDATISGHSYVATYSIQNKDGKTINNKQIVVLQKMIVNNQDTSYVLPNTGGMGLRRYYGISIAGIALAWFCYGILRHKKKS